MHRNAQHSAWSLATACQHAGATTRKSAESAKYQGFSAHHQRTLRIATREMRGFLSWSMSTQSSLSQRREGVPCLISSGAVTPPHISSCVDFCRGGCCFGWGDRWPAHSASTLAPGRAAKEARVRHEFSRGKKAHHAPPSPFQSLS